MGSLYSRVVSGESGNRNREWFVGFVMIFSRKTVMKLKKSALVAYFFFDFLLIWTLRKRQCMLANGRTLVGFLLMRCSEDKVWEGGSGERGDSLVYILTTSTTVPLDRGVHSTRGFRAERKTVKDPSRSCEVVVGPLQKCDL